MGALVIGEAVILVAAFIAARLARTLEIAGIGPFEITARIVPAAAEIIVATVSGPVALIELVALAVPIIATVLAVLVAAIVLTLVVPVLAVSVATVALRRSSRRHRHARTDSRGARPRGWLMPARRSARLRFSSRPSCWPCRRACAAARLRQQTRRLRSRAGTRSRQRSARHGCDCDCACACRRGRTRRPPRLGALFLPLRGLPSGLRLVEAPTIHALGAVAHKLKHFGRIVGHFDRLDLQSGLMQHAAGAAALVRQNDGHHITGMAGSRGTSGAVKERFRASGGSTCTTSSTPDTSMPRAPHRWRP